MFYVILFLSCKGAICNPVFAEPTESYEKCREVVAELPPRKDMKATCTPVIMKSVKDAQLIMEMEKNK